MSKQTIDLIKKWGYDRGITINGTHYGQWLKLMSEFGELCDNLAKGKDIKDDIGDMFVVLVMMCELSDVDFREVEDVAEQQTIGFQGVTWITTSLGRRAVDSYDIFFDRWRAGLILSSLMMLSEATGASLEECIEIAYNDIKDRKGYLNAEGVFIKESLT